MEQDTGKGFVYTAVNLKTGRREILGRRTTPISPSGVNGLVKKMRHARVAGPGYLEADRPFGEITLSFARCREILNILFEEILPRHGYTVRTAQTELAEHLLETISHRAVTLAEAEVGIGKTLAYLMAAILAKRGRLNGFWNMSLYPEMPYIEMAHMPIVIATSSIALQKALVTQTIPALSELLLAHGIIHTPLTAVLRKGREHYICQRNLRAYALFEQDPKIRSILADLEKPGAGIDLAGIDGLSPYIKSNISVPCRCDAHCPFRKSCAYRRFREKAASPAIDIQVCNHNYLLADTMRRAEGQAPLIV